jgi:hypothetical protein
MSYRFKVDPGQLDLAGIIERLGAIIAYYKGEWSSTHERTKEVWGALETLLRLPERKWDRWIPLITDNYVLERGSPDDTVYFKELLKTLLVKFGEETRGYTPAMKLQLAKIIRSALDSASKNPYPQICFFVYEFHRDRLCSDRFKDKCRSVLEYECP